MYKTRYEPKYIVGTASKRPKLCRKCSEFEQKEFFYKGIKFIGMCKKNNVCVENKKCGCRCEETKTVLFGFGEVI